MTEQESFIRAICENPHDDTPRLIFADWLEEHGNDPDRAAFIRGQIELESLPEPAELTVAPIGPKQGSVDWNRVICTSCRKLKEGECRYHQVKRTVDDLWWSFYPHTTPCKIPAWLCPLPENRPTEICNQYHKKCTRVFVTPWEKQSFLFTWTRGFAGLVDCHLEAWMQYGSEVVQWAPVTEVRAVNKQPMWLDDVETPRCAWGFRNTDHPFGVGYHELPMVLMDYWPWRFTGIPLYVKDGDALTHLSQACVNYARAKAGLLALVIKSLPGG